jgi:hypothetical protein
MTGTRPAGATWQRGWRRLYGCVAILALFSVAPAGADDYTPVASSVTSVAGVPLPRSLLDASWQVQVPGHKAQLLVSGRTATGTRTVVSATWTSAVLHVKQRCTVFWFEAIDSHDETAPGLVEPSTSAMRVRLRLNGSAWSAWAPIKLDSYAEALPLMGSPEVFLTGSGIEYMPRARGGAVALQVQFHVAAVFTDTATVDQRVQVNAPSRR